MKNSKIIFYSKALASFECICGSPKKRGKSLCFHCYTSLPPLVQSGLYKGLYSGYGPAYDEAVRYLECLDG